MISRYDVKTRSVIPYLVEIVPPNSEPLGIGDYLNYTNLKLKMQQFIFSQKLVSARQAVENWTGRALITRTVNQIFDYDPKNNPEGIPLYMTSARGELDLRATPVRKVISVTVYDPFRVPTLVDPSIYTLLSVVEPFTRLSVTLGHVWPGVLAELQAIHILGISGYSTQITLVTRSQDTSPPGAGSLTAPGHPYANGDLVRITGAYGDTQSVQPTPPIGLQFRQNYYAVNVSGDTLQVALTPNGAPIVITSIGTGLLYAGEIPMNFLRAIMMTAAADLFSDESDKKDQGGSSIPKNVRDLVKKYKRSWL